MASKPLSCIPLLLATIFIATAVAAPSASNSSAPQSASSKPNDPIPADLQLRKRDVDEDSAQDSEANSTENVKLLILPLIIRQRPIFIIKTDDVPASDPDSRAIVVPTTHLQPPAAPERVDPNEVWIPAESDGVKRDLSIRDSNNDEYDSDVDAPTTDIPYDLHEEGDRRKREADDSGSDESSTQLYEIDQLQFGPIIVNTTDPGTNQTELGLFSLDVIQISQVSPNDTTDTDIDTSRRARSSESQPSTGSKLPVTRLVAVPPPRPAVQPAVMASHKQKRSANANSSSHNQGQATPQKRQSPRGSRSRRGVESPTGSKRRPFSRPLIQAPFRG